MKHLLIFLIFIATGSFAQERARKLELGFGGGLNYSLASVPSLRGTQIALPGFNAGFVANYHIASKFFVSGQVSYQEQSTKYRDGFALGGFGYFESTDRYSWISAPVLFNYTFFSNRFFVGLGLAPQRLLNANAAYTFFWSYPTKGPITSNISTSSVYNEWAFSGASRAGVQFPLKQGGKVLVVLSYVRSLNDLRKRNPPTSPNFDYISISNVRLNSLSLEVNYVY